MPTYEYECQQCGHRFEEFQSITAAPRQTCPEASCKGPVKRLIGMGRRPAVQGGRAFTQPTIAAMDTRRQLRPIKTAARRVVNPKAAVRRPVNPNPPAKRPMPKPIEELSDAMRG